MQPRILFRTHYQVDEPAFAEVLIRRCTSPIASAYNETVAERLAKEVRSRGKDFNIAAAGYALALAHGLGLLNENNVWTEKGHLINLVAQVGDGAWESELALTTSERLLHFRLFLESDGAALLFLARQLLAHGALPNSEEDWNSLAQELFVDTYSTYLAMTGPTADRVSLRTDIDRIKTKGYAGRSGPHQMFIHLQTLYRLGLVDRAAETRFRRYVVPPGDGAAQLERFLTEVGDLLALEEIIKNHHLIEVAARVLQLSGSGAERPGPDGVLRILVPLYRRIMETGVSICPLSGLVESVQIDVLAAKSELLEYRTALDLLEEAQHERMRDIRFHVDRRGRPAFLKLSDEIVEAFSPRAS